MPIKVMIADDHPVVRDGLRLTIERKADDIRIVGEAADGDEVLALARRQPADVVPSAERDNLVVVELRLCGRHGPHVTRIGRRLELSAGGRHFSRAINAAPRAPVCCG